MKKIAQTLFVLALAASAAGLPTTAHGQQGAPGCVIKTGEYRELNFWRQLKVGAAEFVNPTLIQNSSIAYKFDPQELYSAAGPGKWKQYLEDGQLAWAGNSDGAYRVRNLDKAEIGRLLVADTWPKDMILVASTDKLLGVASKGRPLISWDAKPSTMPAPPACAPAN
jgi:hypothetical protein